jgi:ABC-type transport system substrate-binding protein
MPLAGHTNSLDPSEASTSVHASVLPGIFETLTREAEGARIVPWLAAEFHAEQGGTKFRFRLREDVRFHDGRRVTARDVRFSFEHLLQNPDAAVRRIFSPIRGARELIQGEASDLRGLHIESALEFTIELDQPISFFPALLAFAPASIVPEGSETFDGNWQTGCAGTGPFRVVRFDPARRVELEANPLYWRKEHKNKAKGPPKTLSILADSVEEKKSACRRIPVWSPGRL